MSGDITKDKLIASIQNISAETKRTLIIYDPVAANKLLSKEEIIEEINKLPAWKLELRKKYLPELYGNHFPKLKLV